MRKWDFVTQTHNKQRVSGGKTCNNGYANVRKTSKKFIESFSYYFWNVIVFQK